MAEDLRAKANANTTQPHSKRLKQYPPLNDRFVKAEQYLQVRQTRLGFQNSA